MTTKTADINGTTRTFIYVYAFKCCCCGFQSPNYATAAERDQAVDYSCCKFARGFLSEWAEQVGPYTVPVGQPRPRNFTPEPGVLNA